MHEKLGVVRTPHGAFPFPRYLQVLIPAPPFIRFSPSNVSQEV
jgi:hypothetical protein